MAKPIVFIDQRLPLPLEPMQRLYAECELRLNNHFGQAHIGTNNSKEDARDEEKEIGDQDGSSSVNCKDRIDLGASSEQSTTADCKSMADLRTDRPRDTQEDEKDRGYTRKRDSGEKEDKDVERNTREKYNNEKDRGMRRNESEKEEKGESLERKGREKGEENNFTDRKLERKDVGNKAEAKWKVMELIQGADALIVNPLFPVDKNLLDQAGEH